VPELMRQFDERPTIRAHGTAAIPVWGEVFEQSLVRQPSEDSGGQSPLAGNGCLT